MLGLIGFNSYCIRCIIGTEPHEREEMQDLLIDLRVEVDFSKISVLKDTIDYRVLAAFCKDLAIEGKYLLIERYAADAIKKLLRTFPIKSAWIRVRKPQAISDAECALVELRGER
jgi:dihydroneopterin aldolase